MSKPVVILIFTHRPGLSADEEISLRQCWNILGDHPIRLVCPRGMDTHRYLEIAPGIQVDEVDPRHLSSLRSYNRFKIDTGFYHRYRKFEFILTYELDAFVFRDDLLHWCEQGWDYIGAPWFEGHYGATPDADIIPGCNSGFSLRRVSSALKVLRSFRPIRPLREVYDEWRQVGSLSPGSLALLFRWAISENLFNPGFNKFSQNEDLFWSHLVPGRFPWFKLANFESSAQFSFELMPQRLLAETGGKLPFGCHKWHDLDMPFWKPHIEAFGHRLPDSPPFPNTSPPSTQAQTGPPNANH